MLKYLIQQIIAFILSLLFGSNTSFPIPVTPTPPQNQIVINQKTYSYYYQAVSTSDSFSVITNFENPKDSKQLISENICKYAINGGLYLENNRPLGLFYLNGETLNFKSSSLTFNGFLSQSSDGLIDIGSTTTDNSKFIMQSGPFFNLGSPVIDYNEKTARRHVIAKDSSNKLYIFSIFTPNSFVSGPTLSEIPLFFQSSQIQKIAPFIQILTLDGGSASVFYSPNKSIHETTFIGSLLCWK